MPTSWVAKFIARYNNIVFISRVIIKDLIISFNLVKKVNNIERMVNIEYTTKYYIVIHYQARRWVPWLLHAYLVIFSTRRHLQWNEKIPHRLLMRQAKILQYISYEKCISPTQRPWETSGRLAICKIFNFELSFHVYLKCALSMGLWFCHLL